jgi:hypothetical protein
MNQRKELNCDTEETKLRLTPQKLVPSLPITYIQVPEEQGVGGYSSTQAHVVISCTLEE